MSKHRRFRGWGRALIASRVTLDLDLMGPGSVVSIERPRSSVIIASAMNERSGSDRPSIPWGCRGSSGFQHPASNEVDRNLLPTWRRTPFAHPFDRAHRIVSAEHKHAPSTLRASSEHPPSILRASSEHAPSMLWETLSSAARKLKNSLWTNYVCRNILEFISPRHLLLDSYCTRIDGLG
jgi:hypothetical protein